MLILMDYCHHIQQLINQPATDFKLILTCLNFQFSYWSSIYYMEKVVFAILVSAITVSSLNYSFNTTESHLLRNGYMAITSISRDHGGQFLAFFIDSTVRRYKPDLSAYLSWIVPYPVYQSSAQATNIPSMDLGNGTVYNINGKLTTTISKQNTVIQTYSYPNFTLLAHFQAVEKLLSYLTIDVQMPSGDQFPLNLIIGEASIMVYYRGQLSPLFTYDIDYSSGVSCSAAVLRQKNHSITPGLIILTFYFVLSLSSSDLIDMKIVVYLQFNPNSAMFDFSGYAQRVIDYPPLYYPVSTLLVVNNVIFAENINGITAYDAINASTIDVDPSIPRGTLRSVIYKDSRWFMLQDSAFLEIKLVNQTLLFNNAFYLSATIAALPSKLYSYVSGGLLELIYVPGEALVYKLGYCPGNTRYIGGVCRSYTCANTMCSACWLLPNACGICLSGFPRTDTFYCRNAPPPPNITNNLGVTNSSVANENYHYFRQIMDFSKQLLQRAASLPSGRRLVYPLFYFFGNFDDLYLYSFHGFYYGRVAEYIFNQIEDIEKAQWSLLNQFDFMSQIIVENSSLWKVLSSREVYLTIFNEKSENLLTNCYFYFIFSLPVSFIIFILMRALFSRLRSFSISKFIRAFDLWGFLLVLLFDGNIQQFAFFSASNLQHIIFTHHYQKYTTIFLLLFVFPLVILSFGGYFLGLFVYQRLNKTLTDNNKNDLRGNIFLLLQICVRNFILGSSHSFLRYLGKEGAVGILISIEICFVALFAHEASNKIFKSLLKIWIYVLLSLTRILFIFTFLFDHRSNYSGVFENIQECLMFLNIFIYLLSVITLLLEIAIILVKPLFPKSQREKIPTLKPISNQQIHQIRSQLIENIYQQSINKRSQQFLSHTKIEQIN